MSRDHTPGTQLNLIGATHHLVRLVICAKCRVLASELNNLHLGGSLGTIPM